MALSDEQIERYSRQIVLPEVGGRGQQRLLAAHCAVSGGGAVGATAARVLVGAGVGCVPLIGPSAGALQLELSRLNPDVALPCSASLDDWRRRPGTAAALEQLIVADATDAELAALALQRPARRIILAVATGATAWLHVQDARGGCGACVARSLPPAEGAEGDPVAAAVIGALAGLDAIKHGLGLAAYGSDSWQRFDRRRAMLESLPAAAAIGRCAAHAPA